MNTPHPLTHTYVLPPTHNATQQSVLITKTSAEWEAFLAPRDVMCEPVRAPEGVLQSEPQVRPLIARTH